MTNQQVIMRALAGSRRCGHPGAERAVRSGHLVGWKGAKRTLIIWLCRWMLARSDAISALASRPARNRLGTQRAR